MDASTIVKIVFLLIFLYSQEVPYGQNHRKRCIIMVVVALVTLVAFTVILTVCLAKFNPSE